MKGYKNIKVLVVEDSLIMQTLIGYVLTSLGINNITKLENGFETLTLLKNEKYDLILMDWQMPELDGLECTKCIRNGEAGDNTNIPIIMLTAVSDEEKIEQAMQNGVDFYIKKPFTMKEILDGILLVLQANYGPN